MHPQLMTLYAEARTQALREAAESRRRGRPARRRTGRSFAVRLPRRGRARVAI